MRALYLASGMLTDADIRLAAAKIIFMAVVALIAIAAIDHILSAKPPKRRGPWK